MGINEKEAKDKIMSLLDFLGIKTQEGDLELKIYSRSLRRALSWRFCALWRYKGIPSNTGVIAQISIADGTIKHFEAIPFEAPENLDVVIDKQTALDIAKEFLKKKDIRASDSVTEEFMIVRKNNKWSKSDVAPFRRERATRLVWNVTFGDELCELISVYVDVEDGSIVGGL